jgi:glycerol-3-phosphate dehydrogenase
MYKNEMIYLLFVFFLYWFFSYIFYIFVSHNKTFTCHMERNALLNEIKALDYSCDILIIGGGATGLGAAVDASSRGFKVILLEQNDFAKSTSSRSTKLVHGGVRYLAQGDLQLVIRALHERGIMKRNAPHLVKDIRFIIGNYRIWEKPFYTLGLKMYDILSGRLRFGRSKPLSKKSVKQELPGLANPGLLGGVVYHDGQFDDARMAVTLAQTAVDNGAVCLNYIKVISLIKDRDGILSGITAVDQISGEKYSFKSKAVINATGVFVDDIMLLDGPQARKNIRPSQGVHLVVDRKFLGGKSALMIPKTKDGRVLFGVPWHDKVVLGTTDTPLNETVLEPKALEEEVDFILDQAGQYLELKPTRADVLSVFAGLRPLAAPGNNDTKKTKEISRNHKIYKSDSGLLTITGGKWTTYREMAEDIINKAIAVGKLEKKPCTTKNLKVHGYTLNGCMDNWDYVYGCDIEKIKKLIEEDSKLSAPLLNDYYFNTAHVIWAVREEMAQTVEDVLARRIRLLFLDAKKAIEVSPKVASIMAKEMNKDKSWENSQVLEFTKLAREYTL